MFRSIMASLLAAALVGSALLAQAPKKAETPKKPETPKKEAPKDGPKDAPKKDMSKEAPKKEAPKKEAKPKAPTPGKEVSGMFKTRDDTKKTLTLTFDGKEKVYKITNDTKFTGPRGGESDDRLKDDRLDTGYKIAVIPDSADDTVALEVKLPFRNAREGGEKPAEKKAAEKKGS